MRRRLYNLLKSQGENDCVACQFNLNLKEYEFLWNIQLNSREIYVPFNLNSIQFNSMEFEFNLRRFELNWIQTQISCKFMQ
jgi:hypothetical protein